MAKEAAAVYEVGDESSVILVSVKGCLDYVGYTEVENFSAYKNRAEEDEPSTRPCKDEPLVILSSTNQTRFRLEQNHEPIPI